MTAAARSHSRITFRMSSRSDRWPVTGPSSRGVARAANRPASANADGLRWYTKIARALSAAPSPSTETSRDAKYPQNRVGSLSPAVGTGSGFAGGSCWSSRGA
jgi:hypothetical protein